MSDEPVSQDDVSKDELTQALAYALWRNWHLRMKARRLDDARLWAGAVAGHLERCGWRVVRRPERAAHRTPDGPQPSAGPVSMGRSGSADQSSSESS